MTPFGRIAYTRRNSCIYFYLKKNKRSKRKENTMIKPPISRLGGKSRLKNKIISMFPEHECYVEVFCGAGWVYFSKEPSKTEVINDRDEELVNLFKVLKYHKDELERLINYEISSRDTFERYKKDEQFKDNMTDIQKAVRFLYLISQSFASRGNTFGYAPSKPPSQKIFHNSFKEIHERLKNTYVENLDFEKVIKKYDREYTLFFCDPPYIETCGYEIPFKKDDHIRLAETLRSAKGKFLLTINDHPLSRQLYHKFEIKEVETFYTVNKSYNKKVKELIIKNF